MSVEAKGGYKYVNTSTDLLKGHSIKYAGVSNAELTCDLAANTTDKPLGIAVEGIAKQAADPWPNASIETIRGSVLKCIAASAIPDATYTMATAAGTQDDATKLAGTGIVVSAALEWIWTLCMGAPANANEMFTALFDTNEVEQ